MKDVGDGLVHVEEFLGGQVRVGSRRSCEGLSVEGVAGGEGDEKEEGKDKGFGWEEHGCFFMCVYGGEGVKKRVGGWGGRGRGGNYTRKEGGGGGGGRKKKRRRFEKKKVSQKRERKKKKKKKRKKRKKKED